MAKYWKAIVAGAGEVATWGAVALLDGHVSPAELCGLAVALLTTFGVYQVRNAPMP